MTPPQQRAQGPEAGQRAATAARALEARPVATVNGRLPFEDRRAWKTIQSQPQDPGQICTCIWTVSAELRAGNPPATKLSIRAATAWASWPSMTGSVLTPNSTAFDTKCETPGLPWWLSGKESACNAGDMGDTGSIPGLGRSHGEGNGNPFQCSCLENATDRSAWRATVCGVAKSRTQLKRLSTHVHTRGIQMLRVIAGHHSRRFQCSACELEGNRAERASEMTNGFSASQHRFHWHPSGPGLPGTRRHFRILVSGVLNR